MGSAAGAGLDKFSCLAAAGSREMGRLRAPDWRAGQCVTGIKRADSANGGSLLRRLSRPVPCTHPHCGHRGSALARVMTRAFRLLPVGTT
jgi:hypothetical protein